MKLPLKIEYACRVLVQLVPTFTSGQVRRIDELGQREEISPNYLTQILNEMRNAGIVESRRGKHGGYVLLKDPTAVTLLDVVNSVEGNLLQVNSTGGGESGTLVTEAWDEVFEAMEERLKETTLAGIAAKRVIDFSI
jgi:Rrf2 family cysteine metabolism transcriptional repressor